MVVLVVLGLFWLWCETGDMMKKAQFVHVDDNDESVGYEEDYQYDDWGVDRVDLDFKSGSLGYHLNQDRILFEYHRALVPFC